MRSGSFCRRVMVFALLCAAALPLHAASGSGAASFLQIPVGGRPAALGGAYSALAADAYAPVWNPAGLGFAEGTQAATMHLAYLQSMSYEFAGLTHRFPHGQGLGAAVQYFRPASLAATDASGNPAGDFTGQFGAYSLAYGAQLSPQWAFGATGKLVDARIASFSARTYAADLGTLYRFDERLSAAFVLANMGSRLKFIDQGDALPTQARAAATYWALPGRANFSLEGVYGTSTREAGFRAGAEVRLLRMVALRAGFDTTAASDGGTAAAGGLTAGLGLELMGQQFDYAWAPRGDLGDTQYFSLVFRFGKRALPAPAPAPAPSAKDAAKPKPKPGAGYDGSSQPASPSLLWLNQ